MALPDILIDAHHHLWNPVSNDPDVGYVWLRDIGAPKPFGDPTPIQRDYLPQEFLAEPAPARLAASVHLQADGAIADPVAETLFVDQAARAAGHLMAIIGFVDLANAAAGDMIQGHQAASPAFRGVRQILSRLEDRQDISFAKVDYLRHKGWRKRFAQLAALDLSFDLQCYPEQMGEAAAFLSDHPGIPVIIDHAGSPWDQSADGLKRWQDGLAALAALPHVSIKLCGFGMFDRNWNARSIRPLFDAIEGLFGYQRMLFASNFPVDKLMRSYGDILSDMETLTVKADEHARNAFFAGNARRIYRL
jgi:predicted TIM-barrel fold metal-dependent hydrolase